MDIFDVNGPMIRVLREKAGWTRAELSEYSGVPERTIQDIETEVTKKPSLETIKEILRAFPEASKDRSELLSNIVTALPTLDNSELGEIFSLIVQLQSRDAAI